MRIASCRQSLLAVVSTALLLTAPRPKPMLAVGSYIVRLRTPQLRLLTETGYALPMRSGGSGAVPGLLAGPWGQIRGTIPASGDPRGAVRGQFRTLSARLATAMGIQGARLEAPQPEFPGDQTPASG